MTINNFLENSANRNPDKVALVFKNKKITYEEVNSAAENIKNFLCGATQKQDRIGIFLDNSIEFIESYFGVLKSGCICVPLDVNLTEEHVMERTKISNTKFIITNQDFQKNMANIQDIEYIDIMELAGKKYVSSHRLVNESDLATIMFSSGTTGKPKGVALKHSNVVAATRNICEYLKIEETDIDLNALKFTHSFGLGNIHCSLCKGGTVVIEKNFINLEAFIQKIVDENATSFSAPPAVLNVLAKHFKDKIGACNKLRYIVSNIDVLRKEISIPLLETLPGTKIYTYYGLTEASRSAFHTLDKNDPLRLECAGKPAPNVEIKIVDNNGNQVQAKTIGEIIIRGQHVIESYWQDKEKTAKTIKNGWLHTGDLGFFDNMNYLFFVGRKDDVINVGGDKVHPSEIENILLKAHWIDECAAVPFPDDLLGKVVKVFIVPKLGGDEHKKSDVMEFLRGKVEAFKLPRYIEFCESIPKTDSGKKKRMLLR